MYGTAADDYVPIFRVFVNGSPAVPTTDPTFGPMAYLPAWLLPFTSYIPFTNTVTGYFVVGTPTAGGTGTGAVTFQVPNVTSTTVPVVLNVEFVGKAVAPWIPAAPEIESIEQWDMPNTPAAARKIVLQ